MTLLEFYNKVNEGFKPNKIKVEGNIYEIDEIEEYSCKENKLVLMDKYNTLDSLNVEVEIIEEPKKIEKVNTYVICDSDFNSRGKFSLKATEIIDKAFEEYSHKLNEIIDYINSKEDK